MSCLKAIDTLGKEFRFNIDGGKYKTALGGIVTLLLGWILVFLTWYFGGDILYRVEPFLLLEETISTTFPIAELNSTNFFLALRLDDDHGNVFNSSFFTYHTYYDAFLLDPKTLAWSNVQSMTATKDMELCSTKHIDQETYVQERLNGYYCPFFNNTTIGGYWNGDRVYGINAYIRKCDIYTEEALNIKCASKEEYLAKRNGSKMYLNVFYFTNLFISKNLTYPVKRYYNYVSLPMIFDIFNFKARDVMTSNLRYSNSEIKTDTGLIFKDPISETFFEFEDMNNIPGQSDGNLGERGQIVDIGISLSKRKKIYNRNYIKIQDVVANVGGFMGLIQDTFQYILGFYLDNAFICYLINKFYKLQDEKDDKYFTPCNDLSNQQLMNIHKNNSKNVVKNVSDITVELKDTSGLGLSNGSNGINGLININNGLTNLSPTNDAEAVPEKKGPVNWFRKKEVKDPANTDLNKIIEYKKKQRNVIEIEECERCFYYFVCFDSKGFKKYKKEILRFELMMAAEEKLNKKLEITELLKIVDQFDLLSSIVLNENQHFMLLNRDKQDIINKEKIEEEITQLVEEREKSRKISLIKYLKELKESDNFSPVDKLLFQYLDHEITETINDNVDMKNIS